MSIHARFRPVFLRAASAALIACGILASHYAAHAQESLHAAPPASPKLDELARRLKDLTPTYPAPPLEVLTGRDEPPPPLALLGVDLSQNGAAISDTLPALDSQSALKLTAYWSPSVSAPRDVDIEFRLTSVNPFIARSQRAAAGPSGKTEWAAGAVYRQDYAVDLDRMAKPFTGKGYLTIGISPRRGANPRYYPLQSVPVMVIPHPTESSIAPETLQASFSGRLHDLGVDLVLGKDAHHTLTLENAARTGVKALGIVSAFGYGALSQGSPVCEVIFTGENGRAASANIVCGVDTARADYDSYPERANHTRIAIAESSETVDTNAEGRPFRRHKYAGVIPVPQTIGPLVSIEFRALTDRIFEVYDAALLYDVAPK